MTKEDRCDRCGAEAMHRFKLDDLELLFCQHHTTECREALQKQGFRVVESKELVDA